MSYVLISSHFEWICFSERSVIEKADQLYKENKMTELYKFLLEYSDSNNADVVWRLARATCDKAKLSDKAEKKKLMYEAFELAKKALALDENNSACHKVFMFCV